MKKIQAVYFDDGSGTEATEIDRENLLSVVFTAGAHNFIVILTDDGVKVRSTTHGLTVAPVAPNEVVIK